MTFYSLARSLHIAAGIVGFISLWLPLVARKGGALHRRVGWVYVGAMGVVALTALVLSGTRFILEPAARSGALFFISLSVQSAAAASLGVRVLRAKHRTAGHRNLYDLGIASLTLGMGLVTLGWGVAMHAPLLWGFAPVGILAGGSALRYWLRTPGERMHWWFQHMGAMVTSGIGTLTAVLVVNARHLGIEGMQLAVFLGPTVIGITGLRLWVRYYRQKFSPPTKTPSSAHP
ncbi:hypothetical protein DRW03_25710 [Corallococcus sp. H22C18031201]|uniref:hypothetical protein n=1 Tax=Citreicoccus inhibens TaxID=2849499 RepID=UPI000E717247|nr:hypothetical protein [Citreicoccus inhibens]MBU8898073.1 hypothetical protein [Citreicoccus inhibens]RJS17961.1 hypothetical protein DRW03_25710 [Corallococcus sp. H22C18031201]